MEDIFTIANKNFNSRLIVGTGKYKNFEETANAVKASEADIVTVAVRRVNILEEETTPSLELLKEINKIKNDLIIFNTRLDDAEEKLLDIPPLPW